MYYLFYLDRNLQVCQCGRYLLAKLSQCSGPVSSIVRHEEHDGISCDMI